MNQNIDSIKVSCLLYLDRHLQADLADFLSTITRSRRGEVLREVIENGWVKYKSDNGVGTDPEDFANMILENNKKTENRKKKKRETTIIKKGTDNRDEKNDSKKRIVERENNSEEESKEQPENSVSMGDNEITGAYGKSSLSGFREVSLEDIEDNEDDDVIDPMSVMRNKSR